MLGNQKYYNSMHNKNWSAFIKNPIIKKKLIKYNINIILIKTGLIIKIFELNNYDKINFYIYQQLIGKFIYLVYKIRSNIVFVIN